MAEPHGERPRRSGSDGDSALLGEEEIAEDHGDGLVSRREALRRLGLLGVSGATAASLLAGAVVGQAKALANVPAGAGTTRDRQAARPLASLQTSEITFRGPRGRKLLGTWAAARQPRGACWSSTRTAGSTTPFVPWRGVSRRAATRRWRSTCYRRKVGRARSPMSSKPWPRSGRLLRRDSSQT